MPAGTWGSSIRIINPIEEKTDAFVPFSAWGGELHLVVSTARILCFRFVPVVTYGRTSLQIVVQDWNSSTRYVRLTHPL